MAFSPEKGNTFQAKTPLAGQMQRALSTIMKHFKYSVIVFLGQALSKKRRRKIKYVYVALILFNSFLKDRRSVKFDGNTLKCGDLSCGDIL